MSKVATEFTEFKGLRAAFCANISAATSEPVDYADLDEEELARLQAEELAAQAGVPQGALDLIAEVKRAGSPPMMASKAVVRLTDEFGLTRAKIGILFRITTGRVLALKNLQRLVPEVAALLEKGEVKFWPAAKISCVPKDRQLAVTQKWLAGNRSENSLRTAVMSATQRTYFKR